MPSKITQKLTSSVKSLAPNHRPPPLASRQKIGFLGGGQLARMCLLEAHKLGLETHVFCSALNEPATQVTRHTQVGSFKNKLELQSFCQQMDYVSFESEFVSVEALLELENKFPNKIFPKPSLMLRFQNRLEQKRTLQEFKIPTSPFLEVKKPEDLDRAWNDLKGPFVLKKTFGGYDGYGTFFAKKLSDLEGMSHQVLNSDVGFMAEKFVPFRRELAVILVRNRQGHLIDLPLVETFQTEGRCDWVQGPTKHSAWPRVLKRLKNMLHQLDYVGAMGVEFFDTGKELLVNEIAPRVHNSGHYSQDALFESQFLLHVKAGLNFQLQTPQILTPAFAMVNLLGESDGPVEIPRDLQGQVHLYGKAVNHPKRKMGHINYVGKKQKDLLKLALKERKRCRL